MKYFIDFEFLEGDVPVKIFGQNIPKWLIKPNNTIQPISVGICSSDNREYYAVSKDFNLREAWNRWDQRTGEGDRNNIEPRLYWIRENVLKPIFEELCNWDEGLFRKDGHLHFGKSKGLPIKGGFTYNNLKALIGKYGKTNKQIAFEIMQFTLDPDDRFTNWLGSSESYIKALKEMTEVKPEFYGYYGSYDWVVFCWIFGRMLDLPNGFPMYIKDLKQMLDECIENKKWNYFEHIIESDYDKVNNTKDRPATFSEKLKKVKEMSNFPKQSNEHNALDDALWNKRLHKFLKTL